MNFKPTSTKSIVSAVVPLILAIIAFKYKYCTGTNCDPAALIAQQQKTAAMVLIGACLVIYIIWSIAEKPQEPKQEELY
jgi:hypothetical protein